MSKAASKGRLQAEGYIGDERTTALEFSGEELHCVDWLIQQETVPFVKVFDTFVMELLAGTQNRRVQRC